MTEVDEVLAEFDRAVREWRGEAAEADWREAMRFCSECKGWVNKHMVADLMGMWPHHNCQTCRGLGHER